MKKLAVKLALFSLLLLLVLYALDGLYSRTIAKRICNKIAWIFNKQNGTYDFAVLGNSRVLAVIDINALEKYTKQQGINLGTSGSKPIENYLVLNRFLQTNKVKTVLLQLDATISLAIVSPTNSKLPFYETYALMPFIRDKDVYQIIADYTSPIKCFCWRYIPFMRYAEFNAVYSPDKIFENPDCDMDEKGYVKLTRSLTKNLTGDSATRAKPVSDSLIDINLNAVKKIIGLCREKNIRVILFTSPLHKVEYTYPVTTYCSNAIKHFSSENGVPYWDLGKQFINSPDSLYLDNFHTNYRAADELARVVADSMANLSRKQQE